MSNLSDQELLDMFEAELQKPIGLESGIADLEHMLKKISRNLAWAEDFCKRMLKKHPHSKRLRELLSEIRTINGKK